jgi:hypothetical protein
MDRRDCLGWGLGFGLGALLSTPLTVQAQKQAQTPPRSQPPELLDWRLQGQGQVRFFGLLIYDIRLWTRDKFEAAQLKSQWNSQPVALELEYARNLSGADIAKRSLVEMRRQAEITDVQAKNWLAEMEAAFPDVKSGDRISGIHAPAISTDFYVNGRLQRRIADADFSRLFFGIWLSPQSSEQGLRSTLLEGASGAR